MKNQKGTFIEFALKHQVLQFGKFTLKSGRISPYFFNTGMFQTGAALKELGEFYAQLYQQHHLNTPHLFGPAYKGILLASSTAIALSELGIVTTFAFNRKEVKTHGEKGCLLGAPLKGKTTIVDDVITAGTAFREAVEIIETQGGTVDSVLVALDRCERGLSQASALAEIQAKGISVFSIITIFDIIDHLKTQEQITQAMQLEDYQKRYEPVEN